MIALTIDAVVFSVVFIVPRLLIEIPLPYLIRAVPDIGILVIVIALLTLGWSSVRTLLH